MIDRGPEWRAYSTEEHEEKARVGAPTTPLLHDKGLSTEIDWRDRNAYGVALSPDRRARMQRLPEWQRRIRAEGREQSLRYALGEINRMSSALDIPTSTREEAAMIFREAHEEKLLTGRSIEGVAASALYAACRRDGIPRSLDAISTVSRVDRDHVARTYRILKRELELEIAPAEPASFVPQIVSQLEVSDRVEQQAIEIVRKTAKLDLTSGKSPKGYAAAAVYLAGRVCDERVTQKDVAAAADVAEITIRNRYQEQADALGIEL
jgi:transcription initiation factor TFIIB